jgi:hypothetical protein
VSKNGLQTINRHNRLSLWAEQIADCRSSGQSVAKWCAEHEIAESTYYSRQHKVYEMAAKASPDFFEVKVSSYEEEKDHCIATISAGGIAVNIKSGADEQTLTALLRALKSC